MSYVTSIVFVWGMVVYVGCFDRVFCYVGDFGGFDSLVVSF